MLTRLIHAVHSAHGLWMLTAEEATIMLNELRRRLGLDKPETTDEPAKPLNVVIYETRPEVPMTEAERRYHLNDSHGR